MHHIPFPLPAIADIKQSRKESHTHIMWAYHKTSYTCVAKWEILNKGISHWNYHGLLTLPESTMNLTPSIVMDVSAMLVDIMHLRTPSGGTSNTCGMMTMVGWEWVGGDCWDYPVLFLNGQSTVQRQNDPTSGELCILLGLLKQHRNLLHTTDKYQ